MVEWWLAWFTTLAAAALGWFWHWHVEHIARKNGAVSAEKILRDAHHEAEVLHREAETKAREILHEARKDFDQEVSARQKRLEVLEDQYHARISQLETKSNSLDTKEERLLQKQEDLRVETEHLQARSREFEELMSEQRARLQEIAGLTESQARDQMVKNIEDEVRAESDTLFRHLQAEARSKAKTEAQKIITYAIERYAADTVQEVTTCQVHLPSEEMKGRIIGKEGRNIRSIESETGVNVMIDDTPQVIVLSGYDPMRREIARLSLERLIHDGRIHPASIEETVAKVRQETEDAVRKAGEDAIYQLGLGKMHPDVVYTLGRLKFRQSYAQNVLSHSIEMAYLMSAMAAELGLDIQIAKRIGLLHDIGKALTHEVEGSHALIGADLIAKHGEPPLVVNAVAAHHREVEAESVYAHLAMAADAITAARPGARNENTHQYLKRLGDLEDIANSFDGVSRSYAIQAGRELRVLVEPEAINDEQALRLARDISARIESQVNFPGQVKVTVIRETRSIEYAR
ncbi:MAG: ribonuclease Y [Verrucomicrobia bacterium]|nr:ribonuclease Y [Verrucomicrobiota bacterium]MCH8528987.1 ribonuclease Y [Kiritimatiellia bacterium]